MNQQTREWKRQSGSSSVVSVTIFTSLTATFLGNKLQYRDYMVAFGLLGPVCNPHAIKQGPVLPVTLLTVSATSLPRDSESYLPAATCGCIKLTTITISSVRRAQTTQARAASIIPVILPDTSHDSRNYSCHILRLNGPSLLYSRYMKVHRMRLLHLPSMEVVLNCLWGGPFIGSLPKTNKPPCAERSLSGGAGLA